MPKNKCPETESLMQISWRDCLDWAIHDKNILADYKSDTGRSINVAKTAIDQMIDDATGALADRVDHFVGWFNDNIWGVQDHEK